MSIERDMPKNRTPVLNPACPVPACPDSSGRIPIYRNLLSLLSPDTSGACPDVSGIYRGGVQCAFSSSGATGRSVRRDP